MFVPFQRLGDNRQHTGVALGLALSRGLTEAMGGSLEPEETPRRAHHDALAAGRAGPAQPFSTDLPDVPAGRLPAPPVPETPCRRQPPRETGARETGAGRRDTVMA